MQKTHKIANKVASEYTMRLIAFQGSNLSAEWVSEDMYVVWSYKWYPIFIFSKKMDGWYENREGYSNTTKRHILRARPALCTFQVDTPHMRALIEKGA